MSINPLMGYVKTRKLWSIQYENKRYPVSCRQLQKWWGKPFPHTYAGSYQIADAWWIEKKAEIDGLKPAHPHAETMGTLRKFVKWARRHGYDQDADEQEVEIARIERGEEPAHRKQWQKSFAIEDDISSNVDPYNPLWLDRVENDANVSAPPDRRVAHHVEQRLATLRARVGAGGLSPGSFDNTRRYLHEFRDWLGADALVDVVNPQRYAAWYAYCMGKVEERRRDKKAGYGVDYAQKLFSHGRDFITYLAEMGVIPLPPNIHRREYRFPSKDKKIITFTDDEVRFLVENATGQLRLHLLLMLNCGMTQTDIADLEDDEVDWDAGRIVRKRSKTADEETVPTVSYRLWPRTLELLRQYRWPGGGPIVLRTETGGLWVWEEIGEDEKYHSSDNVVTLFNNLKKKLAGRPEHPVQFGKGKTLRAFRKTSSTRIEHSEFKDFRSLFLGHAPKTIAEKHYTEHDSELFDEAVAWLGRLYGFA